MLQLRMSKTLLLDQAMALIAGAALGLLFREVIHISELFVYCHSLILHPKRIRRILSP